MMGCMAVLRTGTTINHTALAFFISGVLGHDILLVFFSLLFLGVEVAYSGVCSLFFLYSFLFPASASLLFLLVFLNHTCCSRYIYNCSLLYRH